MRSVECLPTASKSPSDEDVYPNKSCVFQTIRGLKLEGLITSIYTLKRFFCPWINQSYLNHYQNTLYCLGSFSSHWLIAHWHSLFRHCCCWCAVWLSIKRIGPVSIYFWLWWSPCTCSLVITFSCSSLCERIPDTFAGRKLCSIWHARWFPFKDTAVLSTSLESCLRLRCLWSGFVRWHHVLTVLNTICIHWIAAIMVGNRSILSRWYANTSIRTR